MADIEAGLTIFRLEETAALWSEDSDSCFVVIPGHAPRLQALREAVRAVRHCVDLDEFFGWRGERSPIEVEHTRGAWHPADWVDQEFRTGEGWPVTVVWGRR